MNADLYGNDLIACRTIAKDKSGRLPAICMAVHVYALLVFSNGFTPTVFVRVPGYDKMGRISLTCCTPVMGFMSGVLVFWSGSVVMIVFELNSTLWPSMLAGFNVELNMAICIPL